MWKDVHRKTALTTTPKHLRLQTGQQNWHEKWISGTDSGSRFFPQPARRHQHPVFSLSPVTIPRYLVLAFCVSRCCLLVESGIGRPFEFCQNKMGEITYRRTCYLFAWVNQPSQRPFPSVNPRRNASDNPNKREREREKMWSLINVFFPRPPPQNSALDANDEKLRPHRIKQMHKEIALLLPIRRVCNSGQSWYVDLKTTILNLVSSDCEIMARVIPKWRNKITFFFFF